MIEQKLHEECGVFGIYSERDDQRVASSAYLALYALQHRGQMSCGIAVGDHGVIKSYKDNGLVPEVFSRDVLDSLGDGHIAVGHVRYGTSDNADRANAQPMVVRHVRGNIALCFNGQLTNAQELRRALLGQSGIFTGIPQFPSDVPLSCRRVRFRPRIRFCPRIYFCSPSAGFPYCLFVSRHISLPLLL